MTLRKVGRAFIRALVIVGTAVGVLSLLSYVFYPKKPGRLWDDRLVCKRHHGLEEPVNRRPLHR